MKQKSEFKLNITPAQAIFLTSLVGHTQTNRGAAAGLDLRGLYGELVGALGANHVDFSTSLLDEPITLNAQSEKTIASVFRRTKFAPKFDFEGKRLPKTVVFFEYPDSVTGKLVARLVKVEDEDLSYIKGYEVDTKTFQPTWNFKTFLKSKVQSLIRNA